MSTIYKAPITEVEDGATFVIQNVTAGPVVIRFELQWAVASEEQANIINDWLIRQANSDPLLINNAYTSEYNWLEYFYALRNYTDEQLLSWLNDTSIVKPKRLILGDAYSRLVMVKQNIQECVSLYPVVQQYSDCLRWQFKAIYGNETSVGIVEPGGWYRNQDSLFSFRFISNLDVIGKKDLTNVVVEIEVYND